jgi:hypothetical protein
LVTIDTGQAPGIGIYVFTGQALSRETVASPEGTLEWVPRGRVGTLEAVEDLPVLVPYVLALADDAPPFSGHYHYDAEGKLVMAFEPAAEPETRLAP